MKTEINGTFVLLAFLIPAVLLVAAARVPRWFTRSMGKHALWRLRDDVVDDRIARRLDGDHPAVEELIARVEWAIREARSFDLVHLVVWNRARRLIPSASLRKLEKVPDLRGLPPAEAKRIEDYRMRYNNIALRTILLSSWAGVLLVLRFLVRATVETFRERARDPSFMGVVRVATDEVAAETKIGRSAQVFVTDKGPEEKRPALVG